MRGQPLTLYEREKIEFFIRAKTPLRKIARTLHRDHAVIVRELKRNTLRDGAYRAEKAQELMEARRRKRKKRKLERDEDLELYVVERIIKDQWSPEQISDRLKNRLEPKMEGKGISQETIYQFIYESQGRFLGLYQHLRRKHKKRRRRWGRKHQQKQSVSFITPLCYRPNEINEKQRIGDWESDTTACEHYRHGAISVQYERKTQFCLLTKVCDMSAGETERALRNLLESPLPTKSITFDRGTEGAHHWKLRLEYEVDTYHCDPFSSWQKGGVENLNGLIRQYIPKGTDVSHLTQYDLTIIQEKLNNRPRKGLGSKTPNEYLRELGYSTGQVVH